MTLWDTQKKTISDAFEDFHQAHPEVYAMFLRFTRQWIQSGHKRGSADMILHRVRWETSVNAAHDSGFKINNNFSALYARKAMAENPDLAGVFSTRKRRSV